MSPALRLRPLCVPLHKMGSGEAVDDARVGYRSAHFIDTTTLPR
jgi:hypothetical protein